MTQKTLWENDSVQFSRLIAEIRAIGLTDEQYRELQASMDLSIADIDALFERGETAWRKHLNTFFAKQRA